MVIVDPDISEDQRKGFVGKIEELIPRHQGFLLGIDEWGNRKLAYEIKKKVRGHYYRFDYCGNGACVDEMERSFRIDDRSLKYMTVLLDPNADVEALKREMEKAEEEARAKAEAEAKAQAEAKAADEAKAQAAAGNPAEESAPVEAEAPKTDTGETVAETQPASEPEKPVQEENKDAEEE